MVDQINTSLVLERKSGIAQSISLAYALLYMMLRDVDKICW